MQSKFWHGLIWGSLIGTFLGVIVSPMTKPQKKPIAERSVEVIKDGTRQLMREARHTRKRLMKKFD